MARSSLFASDHDESESTMETDPLMRDDEEEEEEDDDEEKQIQVAAGLASGVLGLLVGGPFAAVLLGFGAAYATQKDGAVGDSARALGEVAWTAQIKARTIDRKHHIVEKSKLVAQQAWTRARAVDRKYKILDTTVDMVQFSWKTTKDYCQRHRVIERGLEGSKQTLGWLAEQIDQRMANVRR